MNSAVDGVNYLVGWLVDLLLWPFQSLDPVWGLAAVSLICGVIFLWIYGRVSSQGRIRKVKREIHAAMLESVLFRHDLKISLGAQLRMFKGGAIYFALAVPPLLVLMIPCILILAQLNEHFGYRPLGPGENAVVSLEVNDKRALYKVGLDLPQGLDATPPLRIAESKQVLWRIAGEAPGKHPIKVKLDQRSDAKSYHQNVLIGDAMAVRMTPAAYADWWYRLLYPDSSLAKDQSGVKSFSITYPEMRYSILGVQMHWVIIFLILSIASGLVASRFMKIEI